MCMLYVVCQRISFVDRQRFGHSRIPAKRNQPTRNPPVEYCRGRLVFSCCFFSSCNHRILFPWLGPWRNRFASVYYCIIARNGKQKIITIFIFQIILFHLFTRTKRRAKFKIFLKYCFCSSQLKCEFVFCLVSGCTVYGVVNYFLGIANLFSLTILAVFRLLKLLSHAGRPTLLF